MSSAWYLEYPHLVQQWSTSNTRTMDDVTRGSNYEATWVCEKGHVWKAPVKSRTVMKSGCSFCSGRRAIPGETDIATLRPDMALEWSSTNRFRVDETTVMSHKKVTWECKNGHVWDQVVSTRAKKNGTGCRICLKFVDTQKDGVGSLYPDLALDWSEDNEVPAKYHPVSSVSAKWMCHMCRHEWTENILDRVAGKPCPCCAGRVLVPGNNDVMTTHPWTSSRVCDVDSVKKSTLRSSKIVRWKCQRGHTYPMSIRHQIRKGEAYCPQCKSNRVDSSPSLLETHPQVAAMWKHSVDGTETTDSVTSASAKMVTWMCGKGHEHTRSVRAQVKKPICDTCCPPEPSQNTVARTRITPITKTHPDIAAQWSNENDRTAGTVHRCSSYIALWNLSCGHAARISVKKHIDRPHSCPVCNGYQILVGVNDLATVRPDLAEQWHEDNSFGPTEVTRGSGKVVKWNGPCGHPSWNAKVSSRAVKGSGCPYCSNNKVLAGFNDLATTHPHLVKEWSSRNTKSASEVTAGMNGKVWWECDKGHTWDAPPLARAYGEMNGCNVCAGKSALSGFNDLASRYPEVAAQWHPTKNKDITPDSVMHGSKREVWWSGPCGHDWKASILNRRNGSGCSKCSNQVSSVEKEVKQFIESILPASTEVRGSDRSVLGGRRELDVYVPSMKIAVEFNGVYWHSDVYNKDRLRHCTKSKDVAAKGIYLIQVWEDDWKLKRPIVENMLRMAFGADANRAHVHDLETKQVTYDGASSFLDKSHVQGSVRGTYYDALVTPNGEIVAVMVTLREENTYHIKRYAAAHNIEGGFARLLSTLEARVKGNGGGELVVFANRENESGSLYLSSGFAHRGDTVPDYMYVHKGVRHHKTSFRKIRFKTDPSLKYDGSLTERQLAKINNIPRVYDSGKMRFVKRVSAQKERLP